MVALDYNRLQGQILQSRHDALSRITPQMSKDIGSKSDYLYWLILLGYVHCYIDEWYTKSTPLKNIGMTLL